MKKLFIATLLIFSFQASAQEEPRTSFSKNEILNDLIELHSILKESHYNIYAYISPEEYNSRYELLKSSVKTDSLTLLEATNLLQRFVTVLKNGHTEISFPIQSYSEYAGNGGTVFPLELAFEDGKALVRKNYSEEEISIGSELKSINGQDISEIVEKIFPQISAEREYFKLAKLEFFTFPRYFWQVFGEVKEFKVEIEKNGQTKVFSLPAVNLIEGFEMKRSEFYLDNQDLRFYEKTAYLNPGPFSGDEASFKAFIDSSFVEISKNNPENLILDFRNNTGGDDSFSDYLVSYIADRPFKWNSAFFLKTSAILKKDILANRDTTSSFWKEALIRENGEIYPYDFGFYEPQPNEKRFSGHVYVLVNRQSYSQSAVTAAQIQDYDFGTIVGEETGEYPSLIASVFYVTLPNTGIIVQISKGYIIRVNGSEKEEGVIPDVFFRDHLLDEEDEILKGLLEKLES